MVDIHNRILLSHKRNKSESVAVRWVNLEPVKRSEGSQKDKNKDHISVRIYGI